MTTSLTVRDTLPDDHFARQLHEDVRTGLTADPKTLPPKWFYDARGSELFTRITRLPEYYPTRAERQILRAHAPDIAAQTRARTLVELGSGSSEKTRTLLDALIAGGTLRHYAPVDVSRAAVTDAAESLMADYPSLEVTATVADFDTELPFPDAPGPRLVAFLGSTIGNFDPAQRTAFLGRLAAALTPADAVLIGADLVKSPATLVRAYDDAQGVTAEFNKNLLRVLNRELGADFDPGAFDHQAVWNESAERVEMYLRARYGHTITLPALDLKVTFALGETLRTELSTKFRRPRLGTELSRSGLNPTHWWTDPQNRFTLVLARPTEPSARPKRLD
ncbi:L-histidine N(alpha)-methyltransferase [Streptomyces sp. DSM 44915]|uniref:L-histidine N(Alpha)-methyltransferase n=1 Tax=Streptomyces chisholmiae TaxID=3075540 RepID=A0ABU2JTG2_9ACTN|nr:L-histidine N(alpha)-methyltransferase [Streptomyces sp. DSM 44915]MDT0268275.1 L-histidine N(alpha)-methyltransferase [Streptomyces sp. DSM 44915]